MGRSSNTAEFIEKAIAVHGDKYDYSKTIYVAARMEVCIICKIHGGFLQTPTTHLKGSGCFKCGKISRGSKTRGHVAPNRMTTEEFIRRSTEAHAGKYDYSKVVYKNANTKVKINCPEHGDFEQRAADHMRGVGCIRCSGNKQLTTTDFITKAKEVYGDRYGYDRAVYKTSKDEVCIHCSEHGYFMKEAGGFLRGSGCQRCQKEQGFNMDSWKFFEKCNNVHEWKYDYSEAIYEGMTSTMTVICPVHGRYEQNCRSHYDGRECPQCAYKARREFRTYTKETFVELANKRHDNAYDYSDVVYVNSQTKVDMKCPKHGVFSQMPYSHLAGFGCPRCSCATGFSTQETKIIEMLNHPTTIQSFKYSGKKEIDILIPEANLGIEINGIYWHSDKFKELDHLLVKTDEVAEQGIRLLHFTDVEVNTKSEIIVSMVNGMLGKSERIYARKCDIIELDNKTASEFVDANHMQGSGAIGSVRYGLTYNSELVAVMTFGKPRFNNEYDWELIRFCSILGHAVVGGASRLLKHFRQHHQGSIISYANRRWSDGGLYRTLGFAEIGTTRPNYEYWKGDERVSRIAAQKHKLGDLLGDAFDPELSEFENMTNAGWKKLGDCGNFVFGLR